MIDYKSISRKIKAIRKLRGYTQEKLAEILHKHQYQISLLENAQKNSCIDSLSEIDNITFKRIKDDYEKTAANLMQT